MYCKLEHGWKTRNRSSVEEVIVYRLESRSVKNTILKRYRIHLFVCFFPSCGDCRHIFPFTKEVAGGNVFSRVCSSVSRSVQGVPMYRVVAPLPVGPCSPLDSAQKEFGLREPLLMVLYTVVTLWKDCAFLKCTTLLHSLFCCDICYLFL